MHQCRVGAVFILCCAFMQGHYAIALALCFKLFGDAWMVTVSGGAE